MVQLVYTEPTPNAGNNFLDNGAFGEYALDNLNVMV
jgi:hypothetical protein